MSIGEFARRSRLSAKALRLYDELGLLPSARVDPDSGYRWYAAGQLDNARLDSALAWAAGQQRQPSDLGLRVTLLTTAAPVTDASKRGGSDLALPLAMATNSSSSADAAAREAQQAV